MNNPLSLSLLSNLFFSLKLPSFFSSLSLSSFAIVSDSSLYPCECSLEAGAFDRADRHDHALPIPPLRTRHYLIQTRPLADIVHSLKFI